MAWISAIDKNFCIHYTLALSSFLIVNKEVFQMEEKKIFDPPDGIKMKAYIKRMEDYRELYQRSLKDPDGFWGELADTS